MALNIHTPVYYCLRNYWNWIGANTFRQGGCFFDISYQYLYDKDVSYRTIYVHVVLKIAVTIQISFNSTLTIARKTGFDTQVRVDRTLCCHPFFIFIFIIFFFIIDFFSYKQHFATFYVSLYDIYTINKYNQTVVFIYVRHT
jgi:hypothetical protein